jgi:hypothetical protein
MFAGFWGLVTAGGVLLLIGAVCYSMRRKPGYYYNLDPLGKPGAFEPLLQKYLHLAEFTIGLATGSIVLLIGSAIFHGKDGHLPSFYASPLLILAASVLLALAFMAFLIVEYEGVQHGNPLTPEAYSLAETLGYSSLVLFCVGYVWLIIEVTR